MLELLKVFGEGKKNLNSLLAFVVAMLAIIYKPFTSFVNFFTPWIVVIILVLFFIMFGMRMFGMKSEDLHKAILGKDVWPWILVAVMLVVIIGISTVVGQELLEKQSDVTTSENREVVLSDVNASQTQASSFHISNEQNLPDQPIESSDFKTNLVLTLFHPKMAGLFFMLLLGAFTALIIARESKPR